MEEREEKEEPQAAEEELPADPLDKAEKYIEQGNIYDAQILLNAIEENSGRKHYLQSRIYKVQCWYNEQRKQLKAAIKAEPDNELYKKELEELNEFRKTAEYRQTRRRPKMGQMGKTDEMFECCCEACAYCGCEAICSGICDGCG